MFAATESLRWVKYDDVYYAALLAPNDEAPVPVEDGHVFVYFLGSESGAVVPIGDTSPYDPHDTKRTSHPAAAEGVLVAQQIIAGAAAAAAAGEHEESARCVKETSGNMKEKISLGKKRVKATKSKITVSGVSNKDSGEETRRKAVATQSKVGKRKRFYDYNDDEEENILLQLHSNTAEEGNFYGENTYTKEKDEESDYNDDLNTDRGDVAGEEEEQHERWKAMEDAFEVTTTLPASGRRNRNSNNTNYYKNNRRPDDGSPVAFERGSIVTSFLPAIRHHYREALKNATESGRIVSIQEFDLVRIVEAELVLWRGQVGYLERLLEEVTNGSSASFNNTLSAHKKDAVLREEEAAAIRSRLDDLNSSFSLERILQKHLHLLDIPQHTRREHKRNNTKAGYFSTFIDPSLAFVLDAQASTAAQRALSQQLVQRYREQRLQRERVRALQQGLGKTGFTAAVSPVMGRWRQTRELLVLGPRHESQSTSRRFFESIAKVERHALKCLATMPESARRLLPAYKLQAQEQEQKGIQKNIYNFHNFQNEDPHVKFVYDRNNANNAPALGVDDVSGSAGVDDDNTRGTVFHAPLISPLRTSFDPRATFALDAAELMHENELAEKLALQSMQYSQSIRLLSEESVWESSEIYDGARRRRSTRVSGFNGSTSRATSWLSSPVSNYNDASNNNSGGRVLRNDWRASAKRAILEQLTLYLRGLRGKPVVLNREQFRSTAKKLLERAVRSESERTGLSMSLQANNANTLFSKDTESRLRKSVDNYILRHFMNARSNEPGKRDKSCEAGRTLSAEESTTWRGVAQRHDDDDETYSVMGTHRHANESPVYDQL